MSVEDFQRIEWLKQYMDGADHIDIETCEGAISLTQFVAAVLSYQPGWMRILWRIRVGLLRLLGQGKSEVPEESRYTQETLPASPGESAGFFKIVASDAETHWVAVGEESHLGAAIGVIAEPVDRGRQVFQVMTVVRYNNWAGPIYFNVIRPFHHVVVKSAIQHAVRG